MLLSLIFLGLFAHEKTNNPTNEVAVSILVAARNEAHQIIRCLMSLEKINYPTHLLEILIGDDQSEDDTASVVKEYIKDKPHFKLISITKNIGKAKGKANVLAQLAHRAQGEYIFVTDADIEVKPTWVMDLLQHFDQETGVVSGTTTTEGHAGFMAPYQQIDWLYFSSLLASFSNLGLPCTAVGNNMAIRKSVYIETGGYEALDFSIVEDYKLFDAIRKLGWKCKNIYDSESLNISTSAATLMALLHQRKRWIIGAKELPIYWKIILGLYGLYIPILIGSFILNPLLGFCIFLTKAFLQTAMVMYAAAKVKISVRLYNAALFEFYLLYTNIFIYTFTLLPLGVIWKGRKYN
jgi:cellulose synthase/poly-beta-1,6-N-acetylglucosamine synthase-like glycosyltransferase